MRGKGRPIVKYRIALRSSVQKRLNRSRCVWVVGSDTPKNHDGGPEVLRNVAMATIFWLSMGYKFGSMITSDALFDSRSEFWGSSIR